MDTSEKENDTIRDRMINSSVRSLVIKMAVPTTIIQIISVIYNTADTYFVAHIGESAAAAVGVGFALMSIIQALGMGLGMGAGSLISRELGAGQNKKANIHASSALTAVIILSVVLSIIGLFNIDGLVKLLGSSKTMLSYSRDYARYILIGSPVMCSALVLNIVLRSEGSARYAMFGITAGGLLNIALDPLFIYTFGLGIAGAAIATSLSQLVSLVILVIPFLRGKSVVKLAMKYIGKSSSDYTQIITTGSPTICRQGLASIAAALLNVKARAYGDAAIAAVTIANKVYLLIRNIVLGIGQGYQPVAGYNYGFGRKDRAKLSFIFACLLGTAVSAVSAVVIFFNAQNIISWFQNEPEVVRMGKSALYFACIAMPFMAYSTYVDQLYQCLGFSKGATFLACSRQGTMFLPLVLILPHIFKESGVLMAQPFADILSFALCVPFQIVFFKKVLNNRTDNKTI